MSRAKYVLAAPLLALALSGCGGKSKEAAVAGTYCPRPFLVQDAQSLTRFKPGAGRDPRDIAFQAAITGTGVECEVSRKTLVVSLKIRVTANAGPSGSIAQGQDFNADYRLSTANPRGASIEEITLTIPFNTPSDLGAYRVAVGLKPTPDELEYNRRAVAR